MALAFRIDHPSQIAHILGIHDIFLSILAKEMRSEFPSEHASEVYTAPYMFLSGRYGRQPHDGGWVVFTPMVPWLHDAHTHACERLKDAGVDNVTVESSVEKVQAFLRHSDDTVCTFTTHGGYPRADDLGLSLDESAVSKTCAAMGWKVPPKNWKEKRLQLSKKYNVTCAISFEDFITGCKKENDDDSRKADDNQMNGQSAETVDI